MNVPIKADEAAAILGVSTATVSRWAARGQVPHFRVGRCLRFLPAAIEAFRAIPERMEKAVAELESRMRGAVQ